MDIEFLLKDSFSESDFRFAEILENNEFRLESDSNQIQLSDILFNDLMNSSCEEQCIIKKGKSVIGTTYFIVTSKEIMKKFIYSEINERELLRLSRRNNLWEVIYFCDAILMSSYRNKGIMTKAGFTVLKNLNIKFNPTAIFAWIYSEGGRKLLKKFSEEFNLEYFEKKH